MAFLHNNFVTSNIPQLLSGVSGNDGLASSVRVFPVASYSTGRPVWNGNVAYLGTTSSGFLPIILNTGTVVDLPISIKDNIDNFWVRGTAGDGVSLLYY